MIDKYFEDNPKPTVCGLALALEFAQRKSLLNYEGYGKEFCNTIKRARLVIEESYEQDLRGNHVAGAIFALKNFNWSDKQDRIIDDRTEGNRLEVADIQKRLKGLEDAGTGLAEK